MKIFHLCGRAMRDPERGENTFFPKLDLETLRCVVLGDGASVRFIFPDIVVDSSRAIQLHAHIVDMVQQALSPEEKRQFLRDAPCMDRSFRVLPIDAWKDISPNNVYTDEAGVPMYGCTAVSRCTAVTKRGKTAHSDCKECSRSGFVAVDGRNEVIGTFANAMSPCAEDHVAARSDPRAMLEATMLRSSASLTEPFVTPSYAAAVPMQADRQGQGVVTDCFECERPTFGTSKSKATRRYDFNSRSNDFEVISAMISTQEMCRRMHPAYSRVTIKKMYRMESSKPVVRVLADGENATFCMGKQRNHTDKNACRASFTIEQNKGKVKMYQECFSPECLCGKRRYCSNEVEVSARLASQLGFSVRGDREVSYDRMLEECADRLFAQIRGQKLPPLRSHGRK